MKVIFLLDSWLLRKGLERKFTVRYINRPLFSGENGSGTLCSRGSCEKGHSLYSYRLSLFEKKGQNVCDFCVWLKYSCCLRQHLLIIFQGAKESRLKTSRTPV